MHVQFSISSFIRRMMDFIREKTFRKHSYGTLQIILMGFSWLVR